MTATSQQTARIFVIVTVVGVFAILGILIAYNSGATAEEAQNQIVSSRISSISRRFFACTHEVSSIKSGAEVRYEHRKRNLEENLDSLMNENKMYKEQSSTVEQKIDDCQADLANERRRKTGAEGGNSTDEVLRLQYELKRIEAAIESSNATRMESRHSILRLIEAYARENDELYKKVKEQDEKNAKEEEKV